jgi:antitoxin ParD1/3/4
MTWWSNPVDAADRVSQRICRANFRVSQFDTLGGAWDNFAMPAKNSLNVALTAELQQFVQERLKSGRYQTASEVVREGLRLLEQQERQREAVFESLKIKLRRGSRQADRGEFVNPGQVLRQIAARKRQRAERA